VTGDSNGGIERVFPFSGVCARCRRERDDLFQHPDGNRYCADVFKCEARYYIQGEEEGRGEPYRRLTRV
jgi:hypothetical protein